MTIEALEACCPLLALPAEITAQMPWGAPPFAPSPGFAEALGSVRTTSGHPLPADYVSGVRLSWPGPKVFVLFGTYVRAEDDGRQWAMLAVVDAEVLLTWERAAVRMEYQALYERARSVVSVVGDELIFVRSTEVEWSRPRVERREQFAVTADGRIERRLWPAAVERRGQRHQLGDELRREIETSFAPRVSAPAVVAYEAVARAFPGSVALALTAGALGVPEHEVQAALAWQDGYSRMRDGG